MDLRKAVIVNCATKNSASLSGPAVGGMVDYFTRDGGHDIGGCVREVTEDDVRLGARADASEIVDYAARGGRYGYRLSGDSPIVAGEASGGLWGRDGIVDPEEWKRWIVSSGSHVMTSVVTAARSDAEALGLSTKEDWQRAIRAVWDPYIQAFDVIEPGNIEWAAAYHVDGAESLHVHIMTIDRSGSWGGDAACDIPHHRFTEAFAEIRKGLYAPYMQRELEEASVLRDWMCARMRAVAAGSAERDRSAELSMAARLQSASGAVLPPFGVPLSDGEAVRKAVGRVLAARPEGDARLLSYARSGSDVRAAVRDLVSEAMAADPALAAAYARYEEIQHENAVAHGHIGIDAGSGRPVDRETAAVAAKMDDLGRRLANAGIAGARRALRDGERDRREMERSAVRAIVEQRRAAEKEAVGRLKAGIGPEAGWFREGRAAAFDDERAYYRSSQENARMLARSIARSPEMVGLAEREVCARFGSSDREKVQETLERNAARLEASLLRDMRVSKARELQRSTAGERLREAKAAARGLPASADARQTAEILQELYRAHAVGDARLKEELRRTIAVKLAELPETKANIIREAEARVDSDARIAAGDRPARLQEEIAKVSEAAIARFERTIDADCERRADVPRPSLRAPIAGAAESLLRSIALNRQAQPHSKLPRANRLQEHDARNTHRSMSRSRMKLA